MCLSFDPAARSHLLLNSGKGWENCTQWADAVWYFNTASGFSFFSPKMRNLGKISNPMCFLQGFCDHAILQKSLNFGNTISCPQKFFKLYKMGKKSWYDLLNPLLHTSPSIKSWSSNFHLVLPFCKVPLILWLGAKGQKPNLYLQRSSATQRSYISWKETKP